MTRAVLAMAFLWSTAAAAQDQETLALEPSQGSAEAPAPTPVPREAVFERLFGEAPADVGAAEITGTGAKLPPWLWLLGLAGLGGIGFARLRRNVVGSDGVPMRIVGRAALGRNGSLALVDVDDGQGRTRRLLVGLGGGAPELVLDLHAPTAVTVEREKSVTLGVTDIISEPEDLDAPAPTACRRPRNPVEVKGEEREPAPIDPAWDRAISRARARLAGRGGKQAGPDDEIRRPDPEQDTPRRLRVLPSALEDRDDLIAEVLSAREGRRSARQPASGAEEGPPARRGKRVTGRGYVA